MGKELTCLLFIPILLVVGMMGCLEDEHDVYYLQASSITENNDMPSGAISVSMDNVSNYTGDVYTRKKTEWYMQYNPSTKTSETKYNIYLYVWYTDNDNTFYKKFSYKGRSSKGSADIKILNQSTIEIKH